MSDRTHSHTEDQTHGHDDSAPGEALDGERSVRYQLFVYGQGLFFATVLTIASFVVTVTSAGVWEAAVPAALIVLAIAQMGVHLVFFLHINTSPDSTNNVMALAFGCIIVALVLIGSLWIMANLDHNMMPMNPDLDPRVEEWNATHH